jgi:hypothetical protein
MMLSLLSLDNILPFCQIGGLLFTVSALGTGHFALWWLSGLLTVASLVPLVVFGPRHIAAQFGSIAPMMADLVSKPYLASA